MSLKPTVAALVAAVIAAQPALALPVVSNKQVRSAALAVINAPLAVMSAIKISSYLGARIAVVRSQNALRTQLTQVLDMQKLATAREEINQLNSKIGSLANTEGDATAKEFLANQIASLEGKKAAFVATEKSLLEGGLSKLSPEEFLSVEKLGVTEAELLASIKEGRDLGRKISRNFKLGQLGILAVSASSMILMFLPDGEVTVTPQVIHDSVQNMTPEQLDDLLTDISEAQASN